jgi:hypothetical protein
MSIGKAQASALADGFLDGFGTGKEDLKPRNTFTELILVAGEFVESCQDNLNASNSNASGKLSASLVAEEPVQEGNSLKVNIGMNTYGIYVNKGVKGTKSGNSTAGFSFKYDLPSRKMVKAITQWISNAKASTHNTNSKKTVSHNERKNSSIAAQSRAYATARSIVQHGIKPTGFLDKAVTKTTQTVGERLGKALTIDITNSLNGI